MVTGLILFTDRKQAHRPLDEVVNRAIDGGARLVVLGEEDLPAGERADLAARLRSMLDGVKGRLVLAEDTTAFRKCHDLDDLVAAAGAKAGFATLSPIFPTRSKPGYGPPLGLAALARMSMVVPRLPVYALGGVDTPGRVRDCLDEGASGVAVMGAVMRAEDPARFVKELMTA
ncbi:thiamine phosphate synthase [Dactylosporangium sp. NPDC005555]|uniref:thiamine phosphate synthase n=1 Tax=Dactylosporangium sp. NPDC005555 TaxID=3154889 RepID=UPI0033A59A46